MIDDVVGGLLRGGRLELEMLRYRPAVTRLVRSRLRSVPLATVDDVVNDVLVVAWENAGEQDGRFFHLWLFRVATHLCANLRRKTVRRDRWTALTRDGVLPPGESAEPSAYALLRDSERREVLEVAFGRALDPVDRELFELRYLHDLGQTEIAAQLGLGGRDAVRVRLQRSKRRLRAAILAVVAERGHGTSFIFGD